MKQKGYAMVIMLLIVALVCLTVSGVVEETLRSQERIEAIKAGCTEVQP